MIKKVAALAITALFSLNASAGYVQYDLSGNGVSGYFVQNDEDQSIATYSFEIETRRFFIDLHPTRTAANSLQSAWTRFEDGGPTNFTVFDTDSTGYSSTASLYFYRPSAPGVYNFDLKFVAVDDVTIPGHLSTVRFTLRSTATAGVLTHGEADYFDSYLRMSDSGDYPDGVRHIVPQYREVPEPTSLALLALGAADLAGVRRRKSAV